VCRVQTGRGGHHEINVAQLFTICSQTSVCAVSSLVWSSTGAPLLFPPLPSTLSSSYHITTCLTMKKGNLQMLRKRDMGILFIMALAVYISLDVSHSAIWWLSCHFFICGYAYLTAISLFCSDLDCWVHIQPGTFVVS
jgi:hypothetical protein